MEKAESSNYFGSFLDAVQDSSANEAEPNAAPLELLRVLDQKGPQSVTAVQSELGIDLLSFSKALETMSAAKLVEVSGEPSREIVSLTDEGRTLARIQTALA